MLSLCTIQYYCMQQECFPEGCVPPACLLTGVYLPRGVSQGVCIPACKGETLRPVNRITDKCKNITLPQTSFAGGNNEKLIISGKHQRNRRIG